MYERVSGFGVETENGSTVLSVDDHDRLTIDAAAGNGPQMSSGTAAAILGVGLGVVMIMLAIPFGIGALAGAVVAPSGRRKTGAKSGALAGGLGGIAAYPVLSAVTGSSDFSRKIAGITPIALGAYMGWRERQKAEE